MPKMEYNFEPGIFDDDIALQREFLNGEQTIFRFDNGFGASVVQHDHSYGGNSGLFELAVIKFFGSSPLDHDLIYDTPVTSDVIGYLTQDQAQEYLSQIVGLE